MLSGTIINREYRHESDVLKEMEVTEFTSGGIVEEPDGTIHLLENPLQESSISLHIYYPAISSFEDMHSYNIEEGAIGVLASGASLVLHGIAKIRVILKRFKKMHSGSLVLGKETVIILAQ